MRSFGVGCLGWGLGRTPPRLHGRVQSFGLGCLRGGQGRTLLATSSGFTVADNLGLGIGQSRAVSPLFGCVACTFLSRALVFVFVGPVARRHTNTNIERCRGNSTVGKEGYMSRGWGHWFESEVKPTFDGRDEQRKSGGFGWENCLRGPKFDRLLY